MLNMFNIKKIIMFLLKIPISIPTLIIFIICYLLFWCFLIFKQFLYRLAQFSISGEKMKRLLSKIECAYYYDTMRMLSLKLV